MGTQLQANNLSPMGLGQPNKKTNVQQAILQRPQPPTQNGAPQPPMMEMPSPPRIGPAPLQGPTGNDIYQRVQHAIFNHLPLTPPNPELEEATSWMQSMLGAE